MVSGKDFCQLHDYDMKNVYLRATSRKSSVPPTSLFYSNVWKSYGKIKRSGRSHVCSSSHYYHLLHLFDIAALFWMVKIIWAQPFKSLRHTVSHFCYVNCSPYFSMSCLSSFRYLHGALIEARCIGMYSKGTYPTSLMTYTLLDSGSLSPGITFWATSNSRHVKQRLLGKCFPLFAQRKNSSHFSPQNSICLKSQSGVTDLYSCSRL